MVGLVEPRLRGRDAQRGRLWHELVRARRDGRPCVVAITGPVGTGKSRLARDILERAHQHGLAHTAWTAWTEGGAGNEGLRGLFSNIVLAEGASPEAVPERVLRWVQRFEGSDDTRFAREAALVLDAPRATATDPDLALRVVTAALKRASQRRAIAVWLDDVHWSRGAARALVERVRAEDTGVALIVTSPEPVIDDADLELELAPLTEEDTRSVITGVLDVHPALVAHIESRAGGNPLLATQLVTELVADEALERRDGKYTLRAGYDTAVLPRDLGALWDARVERSGADPSLLGALALTRPRVGDDVLDALVARVGPALRQSVDRALRAGLLRRRGRALEWVHSSLRDQLCAALPDPLRRAYHEAAAEALGVRIGREDVQHERAAHLYGAGHVEEACAAMVDGIGWSYRRADTSGREERSETLLAWAEEASLDGHRARALAELAHGHAARGHAVPAREAIARALEDRARDRATERRGGVAERAGGSLRQRPGRGEGGVAARGGARALSGRRRGGVACARTARSRRAPPPRRGDRPRALRARRVARTRPR